MELNDFQIRINNKFKKESISILEYNGYREYLKVKCNKCGKEFEFDHACSILSTNKEYVCKDCNPNEWAILKTFDQKKNKFKEWYQNQNKFTLVSNLDSIVKATHKIQMRCNNCGEINEKVMYDYVRGRGCGKCSRTKKKTNQEFLVEIPKEYEPLEEYQNAYTKILMRHKKCGFIWKITPHNLLTGKGCPRCNRMISKGEQKIINFLQENHIEFVH